MENKLTIIPSEVEDSLTLHPTAMPAIDQRSVSTAGIHLPAMQWLSYYKKIKPPRHKDTEGIMPEWLIGIIGVIVGAIIAPAIEIWKGKKSTEQKAHYLTIHIVYLLEQFIDQCIEATEDIFFDDPIEPSIRCGPTPELGSFPDDVDWKSIDNELRYKILNLPSKIYTSKQYIKRASEHDSHPYDETNEKVKYETSRLGILAINIVSDLRKKYKIPQNEENPLTNGFESYAYLLQIHKDIEKKLKKRGEISPEGGYSLD